MTANWKDEVKNISEIIVGDTVIHLYDKDRKISFYLKPSDTKPFTLEEYIESLLSKQREELVEKVEGFRQFPDEIPKPTLKMSPYGYDVYVCPLCDHSSFERGYLTHLTKAHNISKKTWRKYHNKAIDQVLTLIKGDV